MNSTTYLTLDLQAPNLAVVASAKQNDTLGRQIAATLRDGSASFDATGLLCEIRYAKPDGTVGFYDTLEDNTTPAYSIDGNVVTFTLAEQMLTVAGAVYVDVNFYATTGEKLTAFAFVLQVEASVLEDGTIVSSDYYNVLTATLAEAAEIAANLPVPSTATPIPDSASGSAGTADGFSRGNHSHPLNVATSGTPANLGTAANGTSANYARQDHVHAMPSASDVGALTEDDVNYKIFDSVADIGLTSGTATIADAWDAMPLSSILICPADEFVVGSGGVPYIYATVEIKKLSSTGVDPNRGSIHLWAKNMASEQNDLRMFITDQNAPTGLWIPCYYQVLWNNPNPTADFGAQAISIDTTPYRFVMIAFLAGGAERYHINMITLKNCWGRVEAMLNMTWDSTVATAGAQRAFVVYGDNSGVYFENCAVRGVISSTPAPTAIDSCLIPQYIVGIP